MDMISIRSFFSETEIGLRMPSERYLALRAPIMP